MAENTVLNLGSGGDTVRDLARQAGTVKTQVMQLDIGGVTANAEVLVTAGQQIMAQSLPVVLASDQAAVSVRQSIAANNWGQALAVTASATATIINIASSVAGYRIKGVIAHGTGEGYFAVQIAAVTIFSGRIRLNASMLIVTLPNGVFVPTGSAVTLKVTNESTVTADYEATLLGE